MSGHYPDGCTGVPEMPSVEEPHGPYCAACGDCLRCYGDEPCFDGGPHVEPAFCRICGCSDDDCSGCIERTGEPCWWVGPDLCSACIGGGQ